MKNMKLKLLASTLIFTGVPLPFCAVASAQEQDSSQAEETESERNVIIVTARKREESLMEAPLAITALSGETLEKMNLTSLDEVATLAPGFHYVSQSGGGSGRNDRSNSSLVFRGLFLGFDAQGPNNGGVLFIDGAPQIGAQPPALLDVQQVEVLKGPQSAYFGRSVLAGAINFITVDPNPDEFEGRITASYASYDSVQIEGSLEGPLTDTLSARISASYNRKGGQYVNAADINQDLGQQETRSYSAILNFEPVENFTAKFYFNYTENQDGPPAQAAIKGGDGFFNCNLGGPTGAYLCGQIPNTRSLDPSTISGHYELDDELRPVLVDNSGGFPESLPSRFFDQHGLQREAINTHLKLDYEFDSGYQLSSITAYHRDRDASVVDLNFRDQRNVPNGLFGIIPGAPEFARWQFVVQSEFEDFSQEIRLTSPQDQRIRWSIGGNYLRTTNPFGNNVYGLTIFGPLFASPSLTRAVSDTYAIFGGVHFDIVEDLTLSVDGRYQSDKLNQRVEVNAAGLPPTPPADEALTATYNSFSPRISLDYKYAQDSSVYVLFSRGYRPGGFNAIIQGSPQNIIDQFTVFGAELAFDEERLDNYEFGVKSTWLDGRLRTRLAVYYDPYRNGQNAITIPITQADGTINLASAFVNSGRIDLKGFEFEFDAEPVDNLFLSGSLGYTDTDVKNFVCVDGANILGDTAGCNGSQLPSVSKWTGTFSAEYGSNLSGDWDWFTRADYRYQGKYFVDYTNVASVGEQHIVNWRLGIRKEDVSVEAFVTNLFNDDTPPSAFSGNDALTVFTTNEIRYALAPKRTFGVRASLGF